MVCVCELVITGSEFPKELLELGVDVEGSDPVVCVSELGVDVEGLEEVDGKLVGVELDVGELGTSDVVVDVLGTVLGGGFEEGFVTVSEPLSSVVVGAVVGGSAVVLVVGGSSGSSVVVGGAVVGLVVAVELS